MCICFARQGDIVIQQALARHMIQNVVTSANWVIKEVKDTFQSFMSFMLIVKDKSALLCAVKVTHLAIFMSLIVGQNE